MTAARFHDLPIHALRPEAAGAVAITLGVPEALRDTFAFEPGQYLTLRMLVDGAEQRRSYSICSSRARFAARGEIEIGVKPVEGGRVSPWLAQASHVGGTLAVLPPQGRFTPTPGAHHRVGFAAGSGITPLLSIIESSLQGEPDSRFTLVYGNQRVDSIMFGEALQDLKDRYPTRLSLLHVLSRQAGDVPLLHGRLDQERVSTLLRTLLSPDRIDEAFVCGPGGMIEAVERALSAAGVPAARVHSERFLADGATLPAARPARIDLSRAAPSAAAGAMQVVLHGKTHSFAIDAHERVLDVALQGGLDLPWSCKAGVCCTCRARVLEGEVAMERNFTLEPDEIARGFVLTCQARPLTPHLVVSYDER
ncbi:MAG: 2Fe-2S iron-sulfur cluster binding domain-containing protein [Burkholderiales bacterium]|jgi:ring-1,2-phenylacetyl-CoA epoxidase subunit PaaE|nr:2Fe-2S iron-sulfur cluster binding domain-containing protein [Burkholderiales bacterium]